MPPILATVLKRLGLGLVTLLVVSVIIFSAVSLLPGDFGEAVLGQAATEETVAAFRRELGLDRPAAVRYVEWLAGVVQGDLGTSFSGRAASGVDRSRLVIDLVLPRLENTLFLAGRTAFIAIPLALFLGITSALWRNTPYDRATSASTLVTISTPEVFVAYILILLFGTLLPIFPTLANVRPDMSFGARVDGFDLASASLAEKRALWGTRLTYLAQSAAASFNPAHRLIDQTVAATVRKGLQPRVAAMEDARLLYKALMLPQPETIGDRFPHQVSGGQLQRVMTAMAMSPRPYLIVFDEPTTALDVTTQVEVLLSMRKAVEEFNTAAIYITHELAVVAQMADRIKVMRFGEEVEEAPTREMLEHPRKAYTRSLWSVRSLRKPAAPPAEEVLRIDRVDAAYGKLPVLFDVSISVSRGQPVSIVGESGSGKSTMARGITGLLPPSKGEVVFEGKALSPALAGRSRDQLRRIQMIYQMADTAMNPRQTVGEIVGRPLTFYHGLQGRDLEKRVLSLLEDIELGAQFYDRLPSELSGGQKQRICIARALAAEPDVIICDEVTSALDQIVQEGILKLLMRLQRENGLSYLFITHDIATVEAISDQIVVMHEGRVVEQGLKDEVLSPPHPDYTQLLLSSVPEMDPDCLTTLAERRGDPAST